MRISFLGIVLLGLMSAVLAAGESHNTLMAYDYFRNIQYPGLRRPDVSLDKVEEESGDAAGYNQRVVQWWPKKGVDLVDAPEGVELRTWTIRTAEIEPLLEASSYRKWWPETLSGKKQFKAHLLGFRGIGSREGYPFAWDIDKRMRGKGMCPAVVLRLEDGRKRCFTRGSFIDADQDYILDLYEKEMARLRTVQAPPPIRKNPRTVGELYKPGTYDIYSDFFHFYSGSQPPSGDWSPWVNEEQKDLAERYREATVRHFEDFWAYVEYAGQRQRYWNEPRERWPLYFVKVCNTRANGQNIPGFAGGGRGACELRDASWAGFYHEWGHGSPSSTSLGSGECKTDSHQPMADPTLIGKVEHQIQRPYMNLFHGWYPGGLGWTMMGDDPNWGYAAVASLNSMGSVATPMHLVAKLGQERGIWKDGIRGAGDFFGQMGARFAEYDWELEAEVRATFPAPNRAYLVALDKKAGLYRSDPVEAPEMFGVNLVRLTSQPGAKQITVDFQGIFDPDTYSDWRVCIVAVDKDGRCRYSPLWNKGKMSMDTRPGDQRYWLTVTATPYALSNAKRDGRWYGSPFAYKYPYDVQLSGCRPANPRAPVGVNENLDLIGPVYAKNAITGGQRGAEMDWPHPSDTPDYAEMKARLEALREKAQAVIKAGVSTGLYGAEKARDRAVMTPALLAYRANWLLENAEGSRHPNGGGWVAKSATVAPTAYIGPDCMVLDGAQVLDRAIIEDCAILSGKDVVVKDNAKVYGKAIVCGAAELSGYARVSRNILNRNCGIVADPDNMDKPYYLEVTTSGAVESSGPEQRRFVFGGFDLGLQANYEFEQQETSLLEDYYQEHGNDDTYLQELVFYNGVLYGRPGFVKQGAIRAATFNGKDQYAEAAANVADLGEITVDLSLMWAGGGDQTLFDFGTSADNCFKLLLPSSGAPVLQTRVKGKCEEVKSSKAIAKGQWTKCRVEIDGQAIRLWLNNEKVAETKSGFRPADVYPAGVEKRNFLAAARGGKNLYCGALDYARIFHVVHKDFATTPEVPLVASRRIDPDYPQRFAEKYADYPLRQAKAAEELEKDELYAFYKNFYADINKRRVDLLQSDEAGRLEKELEVLQAERNRKRNALPEEFNSRPEIKEQRARYDELKKRLEVRSAEVRKQKYASEVAEVDRKSKAAQNLVKEIEDAARAKRAAELAAMQKEMDASKETQNAHLDGLIEKDPEGKEIRQKLLAAAEELKTLDEKKDRDRRGRVAETIGGFERQIRDIRRRLSSDPKSQDLSRRIEKLQHTQKIIVESQAKLDPRYNEAVKSVGRDGAFNHQRREIDDAIHAIPDIAAIKAEMEGLTESDRGFVARGTWDFIIKGLADMDNRIKALETRVSKARQDAAVARNWDELNALPGGWTANQQFDVIKKRFMARELPFITEYQKRFDAAFAAQQAKWHTKVDWDDRLDWEKEPFEKLTPTVQNWLKRVKPYLYKQEATSNQ